MVYQEKQGDRFTSAAFPEGDSFDYVSQPAAVAVYDDLKSAPRVITIQPGPTNDFIESLASCINEQRLAYGGKIPYSVIREVTENFIHAQFQEVVVSILDQGNTIRFCDQGPGIEDKGKAILPGFTSATTPMRRYIRGVGSGLPLVKDYMDDSGGRVIIEDNITAGAVVTISLAEDPNRPKPRIPTPPLNERQRLALLYMKENGMVSNKELAEYLAINQSSSYNVLSKLAEYGLVETTYKSKRILTDLGALVCQQL